MPVVGEIYSNLKRVTTSYDEELAIPKAQLDLYNSLPKDGETTEQMIEAEQEAFELAYIAAEPNRWKGQERWMGEENIERRLVNILHPQAVFEKLQRAGVDARTEAPTFIVYVPDDETGKPVAIKRQRSVGRMWLHDEVIKGRIGVSARVKDPLTGKRSIKLVTSLQHPCGPEWSVMRFDAWDVPINEKYRGWRTALLQLILKGVLTEEEVDRAFGPVVLNPASELYRQTLQDHRARKRGITL
jgi:hypothetical protein